ncbi:ATP-binding cassette, subfamily G (WHITE), member 2 [Marchantia polymorpha subsp. ruderalis]
MDTRLESSTIDELWRISCSGCKEEEQQKEVNDDEVFHNAEQERDEAGSEYYSGEELTTDGEALSLRFLLRTPSIRIPEAADFNPFQSELKTGIDTQAAIPTTVTMHTNELFNDKVAVVNIEQDCPSSATSTNVPTLVQIFLKFEDVKYTVMLKPPKKISVDFRKHRRKQLQSTEKSILNGVSGFVAPGEILALMGPSGSGKTSLLNILGGRCHNKFSGKITYNGAAYTSALKSRIGFVTQDDVLFPVLTVRETLVFAALLRLSPKMSHREKIRRADTVLRELGLDRCQNTIVGGPFVRGVSGGERKRTSIGYEILVDPSLLLLDEPTSGLDSSTALKIMQVLRANAQVGRVIVTTIHQPSSRMFPMFDKLILLSEGHPLYFGLAKDALDYFATQQFIPLLPMNPADFLIDLATGLTSDMTVPPELQQKIFMSGSSPVTKANGLQESEAAASSVQEANVTTHASVDSSPDSSNEETQRLLVVKLLRSKYRTELEPRVKEKLQTGDVIAPDLKTAISVKKWWTSSWFEQFFILSRRNCKERRKDYLNVLRFAQGVAVALLLGMLWWRPNLDTEQDIRDQVGLLFYMCIFWCTFSMWSTMMVFPLEKNFLAKERAADMYRLSAYFVSSTICDLLAELVHPTMFVPLVYFMAGLKSDISTFIFTLLSVYLIAITAQAFGEFFGALTLNIKRVGIISAMIMLIFLLAGGYYVKNIPVFMSWIRYLSIVYYGFRLLERVQYSPDQTYNCKALEGCLRFEDSPIFKDMSLEGGLRDALALMVMIVVYKVLAYVCLRRV